MNATMFLACMVLGPGADDRALNDAPLHCIQFVDRNEGWAGGADGVIWHTIDGGVTWERQPTPTRGTIRTIQFLTPYIGFAVGREEVQATGGSMGVVLATKDGGLTWARLAAGMIPGIQAAVFFDEQNGIAAGDGTDHHPGGLYRTRDGGRTWTVIPTAQSFAYRTMVASDPKTAALAGSWGRLGILRGGDFGAADVDNPGPRHVKAMAIAGQRVVAVGQNGLVAMSADSLGQRYQFADLNLKAHELETVDLRGVSCVGQQIWIVGQPGTVVFHSGDGGTSWDRQSTGQTLPLNDVHFMDANRGWAVGELGVVLATNDGGKTWTPQRRGGQRAAILCIHARNKEMPLDLMASFGQCDGYLMSTLAVTTADPVQSAPNRSVEDWRMEAAVRKSGGASGITLAGFSVPPHLENSNREALLQHWNSQHSGQAMNRLVAEMVLAIRTWQPEVVITDFAGSPAETLIVDAVREAVAKAGDAGAFPDQVTTWNLKPWTVKKLYGLWDGPGQPHTTVATGEFSAILGDSPRDFAGRVVGLIGDRGSLPKMRGLRLLGGSMANSAGPSLLDGITLAPGGTARRPSGDAASNNRESVEKNLRELKTLQSITSGEGNKLIDSSAVLSRMDPVLDRLPADQAVHSALAIADQYARAGQWSLAKEAYALTAKKYAHQPGGLEALRWLVKYQSSGEARRREELKQNITLTQTSFRANSNVPTKEQPFRPGAATRPLGDTSTEQSQAAIFDSMGGRRWYQAALDLEPQIEKFGPQAVNDPAIRFSLLAAKRQLAVGDGSKEWLRRFIGEQAGQTNDDPWRGAARQELWLMERMGPPPRVSASCRRTNQRPQLDGELTDACWSAAVPVVLKNQTGPIGDAYTTQARFVFDDEYLYIGLECQHAADGFKPLLEKRSRDADVTPYDRVELLLDVDRDYQTYYRLRIDQRGALAEDCWGDSTWNPKWFVATKSDATGYRIEAAIQLSDLVGEPITSGNAWALNIVRIIPGKGLQSWSIPADVQPRPEGCGVMMFIGDR